MVFHPANSLSQNSPINTPLSQHSPHPHTRTHTHTAVKHSHTHTNLPILINVHAHTKMSKLQLVQNCTHPVTTTTQIPPVLPQTVWTHHWTAPPPHPSTTRLTPISFESAPIISQPMGPNSQELSNTIGCVSKVRSLLLYLWMALGSIGQRPCRSGELHQTPAEPLSPTGGELVFFEGVGWFRCSSIGAYEALCDIACGKGLHKFNWI